MTGRRCSICVHPERALIEAAIAGGSRHGDAADRFKISTDALSRHLRRGHVTAISASAPGADDSGRPAPLDALRVLLGTAGRLERLLARAERNGHGQVFIAASKELRQVVETIAKLTGAVGADGRLTSKPAAGSEGQRERILAKLKALSGT